MTNQDILEKSTCNLTQYTMDYLLMWKNETVDDIINHQYALFVW
jgi:hypothetical protein